MSEDKAEELLRLAEETLAQIDREHGLSDEHAEVLAALRIHIHGGPKKTLDDALKAAGAIKGKLTLQEPEIKGKPSLEEVLKAPEKKPEWPEG